MRIGLDAIPLATPKTGIGHYTFELARSLADFAGPCHATSRDPPGNPQDDRTGHQGDRA